MIEITDQNIEIKMNEINKLNILWSSRNITPIGRIALIKSQLISKITHILLSLPTPREETFRKLDSAFSNFIWNQKPPKFRRDILGNKTNCGGLKMTNLHVFNRALKISWIKRLKNQEDGWEDFPRYFGIHKIIFFGDKFPNILIKKIDNPFWSDVAQACEFLLVKVNKENSMPYNIPLWFNSNLNIGFKREWFNKGYTKLSDILDTDGIIFSHTEMKERGLNLNFLEYEKLRFDIFGIKKPRGKNNMFGPYILQILLKIGYNIKGCANTYNYLMEFNQTLIIETQTRWGEILNEEIPFNVVEKSFKNLHKMKEGSFTKYLQFKMLHMRIVTNKKLMDMGIAEISNCPYCGESEETIEHAFIYCETAQKILDRY